MCLTGRKQVIASQVIDFALPEGLAVEFFFRDLNATACSKDYVCTEEHQLQPTGGGRGVRYHQQVVEKRALEKPSEITTLPDQFHQLSHSVEISAFFSPLTQIFREINFRPF